MVQKTTLLIFFVVIGGMELVNGNVLSRTSCIDVTRKGWGARPTRSSQHMNTPVDMVFIHHSAMNPCFNFTECAREVRIIQDFHMDVRGWDDIGYSFLVGQDGNVYEGRGWNRVGAHTLGYNDVAVGICVMGDFTSVLPNPAALNALRGLIACGVSRNKITVDYSLFGHRDSKNSVTECPGTTFYNLIREWPHYDKDGPPPSGSRTQVNSTQLPTQTDALYYSRGQELDLRN